ncbi:MAG: hypothetical protein M3P43_06395, partial [Actinomycetota bacterium]|nr:hypothetical protein [Actinomycetota bacterium]
MKRRSIPLSRPLVLAVVAATFLLTACGTPGGASQGTVAFIPGYAGGGGSGSEAPIAVPSSSEQSGSTVTVSLGETDATHMFIHLSQPFAPEGTVTFLVTNTGQETHEFVALASKT